MSETEGTRARPLKPHEIEPFLTIGTTDTNLNGTVQRCAVSIHGRKSRQGRPGSGSSDSSSVHANPTTPRSCGPFSTYGVHSTSTSNTRFVGKENTRYAGPRAPNRMLTSYFTGSQRLNTRVKMPFKHDIRKPTETPWQEPAQDLRELTALATYHMNQLLSSNDSSQTKKKRGHLLKGKLKPLYPVNIHGPSIKQCRGILSETRTYSASASRTLQRRRQIVTQLKSGALSLGSKTCDSDDGSESVHRVSAASSVEDLREDGDKDGGKQFPNGDFRAELACMEQDALFSQELEEKLTSKQSSTISREGTFTEPETLPLQQEVTNTQNGDHSASYIPPDSGHSSNRWGPKGKTEQDDGRAGEVSERARPSAAQNLSKEIKSQQSVETSTGNGSLVLQDGAVMNSASSSSIKDALSSQNPPKGKRPLSAEVKHLECPLAMSEAKVRPRTAVSNKTVRFAEHAHSSDGKRVPVSKSNSWVGRDGGRKKENKDGTKERKKPSGQGCKPADLNTDHRRDDDDEDDKFNGGDGRKGGGERRPVGSSSSTRRSAKMGDGLESSPQQNRSPQDDDRGVNISTLPHQQHCDLGHSWTNVETDSVDQSYVSDYLQCTPVKEGAGINTTYKELLEPLRIICGQTGDQTAGLGYSFEIFSCRQEHEQCNFVHARNACGRHSIILKAGSVKMPTPQAKELFDCQKCDCGSEVAGKKLDPVRRMADIDTAALLLKVNKKETMQSRSRIPVKSQALSWLEVHAAQRFSAALLP